MTPSWPPVQPARKGSLWTGALRRNSWQRAVGGASWSKRAAAWRVAQHLERSLRLSRVVSRIAPHDPRHSLISDLSESALEYLAANQSAATITVSPDGIAKAARVGVAMVDGKLWSSGTQGRARTRRLRRDPRCTLFVLRVRRPVRVPRARDDRDHLGGRRGSGSERRLWLDEDAFRSHQLGQPRHAGKATTFLPSPRPPRRW